MRLLRIGHRVFNMSALVTAMFPYGYGNQAYVTLLFAAPEDGNEDGQGEIRPYRELLQGPEVEIFKTWLEHNSDGYDLPPAPPAPAEDPEESIPF